MAILQHLGGWAWRWGLCGAGGATEPERGLGRDAMMAGRARPRGRRRGRSANHTHPACQVGQELELPADRTEAPPPDLGTGRASW